MSTGFHPLVSGKFCTSHIPTLCSSVISYKDTRIIKAKHFEKKKSTLAKPAKNFKSKYLHKLPHGVKSSEYETESRIPKYYPYRKHITILVIYHMLIETPVFFSVTSACYSLSSIKKKVLLEVNNITWHLGSKAFSNFPSQV